VFRGFLSTGCGRLCPWVTLWVRIYEMLLTASVAVAGAWLRRGGRGVASPHRKPVLERGGRQEPTAPAHGGRCQGAAGAELGVRAGLLGDWEQREAGARCWHRKVGEAQLRRLWVLGLCAGCSVSGVAGAPQARPPRSWAGRGREHGGGCCVAACFASSAPSALGLRQLGWGAVGTGAARAAAASAQRPRGRALSDGAVNRPSLC